MYRRNLSRLCKLCRNTGCRLHHQLLRSFYQSLKRRGSSGRKPMKNRHYQNGQNPGYMKGLICLPMCFLPAKLLHRDHRCSVCTSGSCLSMWYRHYWNKQSLFHKMKDHMNSKMQIQLNRYRSYWLHQLHSV